MDIKRSMDSVVEGTEVVVTTTEVCTKKFNLGDLKTHRQIVIQEKLLLLKKLKSLEEQQLELEQLIDKLEPIANLTPEPNNDQKNVETPSA